MIATIPNDPRQALRQIEDEFIASAWHQLRTRCAEARAEARADGNDDGDGNAKPLRAADITLFNRIHKLLSERAASVEQESTLAAPAPSKASAAPSAEAAEAAAEPAATVALTLVPADASPQPAPAINQVACVEAYLKEADYPQDFINQVMANLEGVDPTDEAAVSARLAMLRRPTQAGVPASAGGQAPALTRAQRRAAERAAAKARKAQGAHAQRRR